MKRKRQAASNGRPRQQPTCGTDCEDPRTELVQVDRFDGSSSGDMQRAVAYYRKYDIVLLHSCAPEATTTDSYYGMLSSLFWSDPSHQSVISESWTVENPGSFVSGGGSGSPPKRTATPPNCAPRVCLRIRGTEVSTATGTEASGDLWVRGMQAASCRMKHRCWRAF